MSLVGARTDRVLDEDDVIAPIDRIEDGGDHADIGFRAADDERLDLPLAQDFVEPLAIEGRIDRLVEDSGRRHVSLQGRHEIDETGRRHLGPREIAPALEIAAPATGHLVRVVRGEEAREDRRFRPMGDQAFDDGQDPVHPGCAPVGLLGEHALHVDA